MVGNLIMTLLLEFVVIHSAGFMGLVAMAKIPRARRAAGMLGLGAFYTAFVWPIATLSGETWMIWAFWGLVANRLWSAVGPAAVEGGEAHNKESWGLSVLVYLVAVLVTAIVPLPAFGLGAPDAWTPPSNSGGLWNERPQQALAAGLLYFGGGAAIRARWFR